jgi:hypothetical protein
MKIERTYYKFWVVRCLSSILLSGALLLLLANCSKQNVEEHPTLFTELSPDSTGVAFVNNLKFDQEFNIYTYRNFYNGGGVGLADINNDNLVDVYLISNQGTNKLFLNKGNFQFEDITDRAKVGGTKAWSTGVSFADVNGDGWMDIYVCNSGDVNGDDKENELFINNHDLTFTEKANEYGVADKGYTTHAAFFDFDRDNDLDLYILNNSFQAIGSFNLQKNERPKRDSLGGHKFFRNDNGHFTDISEKAGIYGSVIGFGLGVAVGDFNRDGWPDIYVSNDFFERDYLYVNNKNGTFKECLPEQMKSISGASMGADIGDINNDGWPDIFVTEMLPKDNERLKTVTTFENWDRYQQNVRNGYYHQFTRNMLQLNNGNGVFSEVGRLTGMEATDWSWGALIFDMDNDGRKDVFVANGIYQDLTDQDYLQYVSNEEVVKSIVTNNKVDYKKLVEVIPSTPVADFAFQNNGGLTFTNKADEWGLGKPNFSNGAAYGDLDNDGDLDLVVNRLNEPSAIVRNNTRQFNPANRYLRFELTGTGANMFAVGALIEIKKGETIFYVEQFPNRGFESSVDHRPNIGLGAIDTVDVITVTWPDGKKTVLNNVATNQVIKLSQHDAQLIQDPSSPRVTPLLTVVEFDKDVFVHEENDFVDFDRDKLVYHMLSREGPRISTGDINGDGLDDFFVGGAKGFPSATFVQNSSGKFNQSNVSLFENSAIAEDLASLLFDADKDGDLDLYVCTGSNEFSSSSDALADRLYFNDGNGNFTRSNQVLPTGAFENTSTVKASDFDRDGDLDLFVGIRSNAFLYGEPMNGYLLANDGRGKFKDVTGDVAPGLSRIGMITDASWGDVDGDKDDDLIVVGEYMPIKVFYNEGAKLVDKTELVGLGKSNGWWNRVEPADLDQDGDLDFVVANYGLNSRFKASADKPISMYVNDFDKNGTVEQIVCMYSGDKNYPMVLRHDLVSQIPSLKKKYLRYESYKDQTIENIFTPEEMKGTIEVKAFELGSGVLWNDNGILNFKRLPIEAQYSPMYAIEIFDFDSDGNPDILMGGNQYGVKPEIGRYDASYGVLLKGNGKKDFNAVSSGESGFLVQGEIRDMSRLKLKGKNAILVARNNASVVFYYTK